MLEERIKKNIEVLAALANNSNKSEVSQELLNQYSGWGGLKEAIYNPSVYTELKRYLNEEEINSVRKTLGSAYYTPELLVKFMWTALERMGFRKGEILEPAVGTGIFLDHMPEKVKQVSNIEAIEIDKVTCNILVNKHPEVNLICSGFENIYFGKKKYDLIISNPPYGREPVNDIFNPDLSHLIIHHWFVAKSARILKDRGIIAMVVPQFFLDNVKDHARNVIDNAGVNMLVAYRLPDNLFANAKITVDIVFLQKATTNTRWLTTQNITIGKHRKPINEYFVDNPDHILGELQIVPMYDRMGVTCKTKGNLRDQLYDACLKIKRLS
jgi:type I restriction-modification system DNA methylase subunit